MLIGTNDGMVKTHTPPPPQAVGRDLEVLNKGGGEEFLKNLQEKTFRPGVTWSVDGEKAGDKTPGSKEVGLSRQNS